MTNLHRLPKVLETLVGEYAAPHGPVRGEFRGIPLRGLPLRGIPSQGLPLRGIPSQGLPQSDDVDNIESVVFVSNVPNAPDAIIFTDSVNIPLNVYYPSTGKLCTIGSQYGRWDRFAKPSGVVYDNIKNELVVASTGDHCLKVYRVRAGRGAGYSLRGAGRASPTIKVKYKDTLGSGVLDCPGSLAIDRVNRQVYVYGQLSRLVHVCCLKKRRVLYCFRSDGLKCAKYIKFKNYPSTQRHQVGLAYFPAPRPKDKGYLIITGEDGGLRLFRDGQNITPEAGDSIYHSTQRFTAVTVDLSRTAYAASCTGNIYKFDPMTGKLMGEPFGDTQLNYVSGMAKNEADGRLFVSGNGLAIFE